MLKRTWVIGPSLATSSVKVWIASISSFCSGSRVCQNIDWVVIERSVPPVT